MFEVSVTPGGTGTLQLQVKSGAVLEDIAGNALDTAFAIADDTIITVESAPAGVTLLAFSEGVGPGGAGDKTFVTGYDASTADKLVVVLGAEHGFSNNPGGAFNSVTYGGVALTEAVQEESGVPTVAIFYLDDPGAAGDIVINQESHNGSIYAIYQLVGTAPGAGSTNVSTSNSVSLTTTASNSLVIAGILDAGPAGGNGAPNLTADAPLTEDTLTDLVVGSRWTSLSAGSATVASPGAGTYSFSNAGGTDLLAIAAVEFLTGGSQPDTIPPTLAATDIVDDQGGANVDTGTLVTYTVTFSEDIDDTTVSASDFANAGSSAITIGSITETSPGVFAVQATPIDVGTLQLEISAGAVITDVAGNALDTSSATLDNTTLTVDPIMVTVPDVAGLTQANAESAITSAILTLGNVTTANSDTVPAGDVISQSLTAGASVVENTPVDLVVSLGVQMVTVPNVVGLTQANAESSITAAILTVGNVTTASSETVPIDDVISQGLTAGASVVHDTSVDLVVSLGDQTSPNPDPMTWASVPTAGAGDPLGTLSAPTLAGNNPATGAPWQAGDTYRLVFVTSGTRDATSANIADYNAFVQAAADAAGLGAATWKVVGSTDTIDARDNTSTNPSVDGAGEAVYLMDGSTLFANGYTDLWNGANVFLSIDENGATPTTDIDRIFTGTISGGTKHTGGQHMGGSPNVQTGRADKTGNGWIVNFNITASSSTRMFAISDPITIGGSDSISMTANTATDGSGVEYNFTETSGNLGGDDSGWQDSPVYIDTGLQPGTEYTYTVTARDKSVNQNATAPSAAASATTAGTPPDTTPPTLASSDITDDQSGGPVDQNTLVTYTVTFSEDIDNATVDAADFSNAGTSAVTIGAITETSPGVFTVEVTPTDVGTLQFEVSAGAVLTDVAGNVLDTTAAISDDTTLTVDSIMVTVPDVVGQTQASAESAITAAILTVGNVTTEYSASVPAGNVISQGLAAGASVPHDSAVDLVVSLGLDLSPKLVRTTVNSVSSTNWTTVNLGQIYNSAVIVATPIYTNNTDPSVVTRITNVTSTGFDLKVDRADGLTDPITIDVSVIAIDEGIYTQAVDGVTMEAVKFTSTVTAGKSNWVADSRTYQNSYTTPVVVGQVMSANDSNWSAFWSMGSSQTNPADASNLNLGKHIGEDTNTTRADETIGYIVIESGSGTINGVAYEAALGADTVRGFDNSSSPYTYSLSGGLTSASAAAVSISAMDGNNGAWGVLAGNPAFTTSSIGMYAVEDQVNDSERAHTTTQMSYIVFE